MNNKGKQKVALDANWEVLTFYGDANMAILFQNFVWWLNKHEAEETPGHFHEGHWWTYYSAAKLQTKLFSFWSRIKITRMLAQLEKDGFLVSGSFNKMKADRTKWYRLGKRA